MSYMPPSIPKKRPVYPASEDIMQTAVRNGKFSNMPFDSMKVGESFVVQESEGIPDKYLRSHVSLLNAKGSRKFRVKRYKDQGFWQVCRMPDDFKFVQGRKAKQKTTEKGSNFDSPVSWGQQLGHGMGQE